MVISSATGCGSNSNTSKELNISLYRLPGENRKLHGSKNFGEKSCWQMKISEYAIYILEKNVLSEICGYTVLIFPFIHPIILAYIVRKVWWNYSEVTLNIVIVHVFLITEAGTEIYATTWLSFMWARILENTCERAWLKANSFMRNTWVE